MHCIFSLGCCSFGDWWTNKATWCQKEIKPSGLRFSFLMPPPLGAEGIMFSGCPSVRPSEARNSLFPPVHGSLGPSDQPWPFYGMSVRPSGRFCMLMYRDHLQTWSDYGHGLFIFLLLAPLWLRETGQIWSFQAFPGKRMEGMGWNFVC